MPDKRKSFINLDNKDKEIISYLRTGKRVNISEIARNMNLPISTVSDRIRRIEQRFVYKRTSLLYYDKLGYNCNAFAAFICKDEKNKQLFSILKDEPCVNSFYKINSKFSFLAELIFYDLSCLFDWVSFVKKKVDDVEVMLFNVLAIHKKECFIPDQEDDKNA